MLKPKTILLFCLASFLAKLNAQDVGKLCLIVSPKHSFAKIDGQVLDMSTVPQPYCLDLSVGKHLIQFWAKEFEIFSDTVTIENGKTKTYAKGLNITSPAFKSYHAELKQYHKKKISRALSVSGAIAGSLLLTTVVATAENNVSDLKSQVDAANGHYKAAVSTGEIAASKKYYYDRKNKYEKGRRIFYSKLGVGIPVTILSYYCTWRLIKKLKSTKPQAPVYEAKNPWAFSNFDLDGNLGLGYCEMKLTYKF